MNPLMIRLGIDPGRLGFALRTTLAAIAALILAWLCGFEHPQWSAMSVWAASQPLRGQLIEKSFFRFCGTLLGTIAGVALVQLMQIDPLLLVIGLALWVAFCTALGHLQRGYLAYGCVLAGYSAAMVSLLEVGQPENVMSLGADRLGTVLLGVLVATVAGLLFAPKSDGQADLQHSLRVILADCLEMLGKGEDRAAATALLARIAAAEEALDPHGAGSWRSRREIRSSRAVLIALIPLLLHRRGAEPAFSGTCAAALRASAATLRSGALSEVARQLTEIHPNAPALADALGDLARALRQWPFSDQQSPHAPRPLVVLHRDWIGAREAALRALGSILVFGVIWRVTGWEQGNFMLLGLCIMLSVISMMESPVQFMRHVLSGQIAAVVAVLACRFLLWPFAGSEFEMVLAILPFVVVGGVLTARPKSAMMSFDYNMVTLLLLQPHFPATATLPAMLMTCAAVVMAPALAWVIYRLVFPATLKRRIETLEQMMQRDLADLAADSQALAHRQVWRARLYHRTLRLIRMSGRLARAESQSVDRALHSLSVGQMIMRLHLLLAREGESESQRRAAKAVLQRLSQAGNEPQAVARTLAQAHRRFG